ncbi:zinc finger protein 891-like isoform X3 [Pararge aegeria]|uniref:zinc finger protein 891-like isoform X3 n=1 Tax=Pararge aegeria TaxID=116150 RepID=UPI0019D04403|nr:zinc finger protein 891-like isoform X3 [Pararge aegeria]
MDINKCRLCLKTANSLITIFDGAYSKSILSSKIMNLTNVEIYPNDGLPSSICVICNQKLDECIQFINLCKKSDFDLRKKSNYTSVEESDTIKVNENANIERELSKEFQCKDRITVEDCCTKLYEQKRLAQKQQCFTCGKIMSSRFRLKTHLATHLKDKQHSCTYCKKQFTIVENLNAHLRIHTGEKPYHCATCGETFAQSSGLIVHKRKHTGQMPYQCVLCPRRFKTIGNYKYHVRNFQGAHRRKEV